jgi:tRNA threonylcarbamoyladenosine biosynthesis protein TsaE
MMPVREAISGGEVPGRLRVLTRSPEETRAFARRLGSLLAGGEFLALCGPLGAGKTAFVKGVAEGMGIDPRDVTSPTFLLIHEIPGPRPLCHADAYRARDGGELREAGLEEGRGPPWVIAVEWADRVPDLLPADHLSVVLGPVGEEAREILLEGRGPSHAGLLARFAEDRP